jgi:hypothetical protein
MEHEAVLHYLPLLFSSLSLIVAVCKRKGIKGDTGFTGATGRDCVCKCPNKHTGSL